jgi:phage FluMu protein Com
MVGIEAGRRVGWAKFYDEASEHGRMRQQMLHRLGVLVGFLQEARWDKTISKGTLAYAAKLFVEEVLIEPQDRPAFEQGIKDSAAVVQERWADRHQEVIEAFVPSDAEHEGTELRVSCLACKKALAFKDGDTYLLRCPRCSRINSLGGPEGSVIFSYDGREDA